MEASFTPVGECRVEVGRQVRQRARVLEMDLGQGLLVPQSRVEAGTPTVCEKGEGESWRKSVSRTSAELSADSLSGFSRLLKVTFRVPPFLP
jgi:hypothetical protein